MISKKLNTLSFVLSIGLTLIVLLITAQRFWKHVVTLPVQNVPVVNTIPITNPIQSSLTLRDSIVNFGMEYLGTPYLAAGCTKDGFDCSGYVYFVYQHFNIKVPRSSIQYKNFGKEVPLDKLKKGDILLFLSPTRNVIGHVGIVINPNGNETEFIHSSSGHEMKVIISSLKTKGYAKRFVKAVNVL